MPMASKMRPAINPEMIITKLHPKILHQLSGYLDMSDASSRPYWMGLIDVIPEQLYSDMDINRFSMESVRLNGSSSSLQLLRDLGNRRGKTVKQLASYLDKLHYEKPLSLIKSPEPLTITHQPVSASVAEGEATRVGCKARGFPYPRYQWYRAFIVENEEIVHEEVEGAGDSILELDSVAHEDAGGYCCKVYHIHNGKTSAQYSEWAYLTVIPTSGSKRTDASGQLYSVPVIIEQPSAKLKVYLGKELTLTCRASGCPQPSYQWYKLEEDTKTSMSKREPLKGFTTDTLQFAQACSGDSGQYMCCARNSQGEDWSITASVTVETLARRSEAAARRCRIEIVRHPMSVECLPGMDQKLECLASCTSSKLFYQWYKEGQEMADETSGQLGFDSFEAKDSGAYFCRVTAENGQYEDSETARLQMVCSPDRRTYTAVDKVALLIGNEDYRSGDTLVAPGNDMFKLADKLKNEPLNFKVVSLLDLTLVEMRKALDIFTTLLNQGVYGLFYFSGHGFEHDGQSYMVPHDAPSGYLPEDCMCAQEVLDKMQGRDTALNIILLDICRKFNDCAQGPAQKYKPTVRGNTVFGYAAQTNSEAYEVKGAGYAIFTRYLVKRIHEDESIMVLLSKVLEDVKNDKDAGNKQFPAVMYDLNASRSLGDQIIYQGHTAAFNVRQEAWEKAHALSQDMNITLSMGITVHVKFDCRFSNLMHVGLLVLDKGNAHWCIAELGHFPVELDIEVVDEEWNVKTQYGVEPRKYRITKVKNVQRLRDDLTLRLKVTYGFQGQQHAEEVDIPVGRPLIADVWLLDDQLDRGPTESDDYADSTTTDSTGNSLL